MAKQTQVGLHPLEEVESKIFKKIKLSEPMLIKRKDILDDTKNLKLAAKFCDSTYRIVNSEISQILTKRKSMLVKGSVSEIMSEMLPDEAIHGQRYILYAKNKKVFLVGDTLTALKKLSN